MKAQIYVNNRDYTGWEFKNMQTGNTFDTEDYPILKNVQPLANKLFSRDILSIDESGEVSVVKSILKNTDAIAGVLILEGNKMYGRVNGKKLLYKCIPDDKYLPTFLVPYELKIGFSKNILNKYVVFRFQHWDDKHPRGLLLNTLGDVNNIEVFYEYQLYCKSLCISLTEFTKNTKKAIGKNSHDIFIESILENPNYDMEDRRNRRIITIDPHNSVDFDDGFGVEPTFNNDKTQTGWTITIYIANVFVWLETLDLWSTFSHRVSTIYLPDRKRPMLPTILSDTLCSLQEKQNRFALAMDIDVDINGKIIPQPTKYKNVLINVYKNYTYEGKQLIFNEPVYQKMYDIAYLIDKDVRNSRDLVAFWMIYMNAITGINMINNKVGVFRSVIIRNTNNKNEIMNGDLSVDSKRAITNWNNTSGQYIHYSDDIDLSHELINITAMQLQSIPTDSKNLQPYIHITSPIRRLVDLLNQIILFDNYKLVKNISASAYQFLNEWISKLDYLNTSMRSIKKIQSDCSLLYNCTTKPTYMDTLHNGVVFDKIIRNNGSFHYTVYLEDLHIMSRITTPFELEEYSVNQFKLFVFENEEKMKKKIKLQIV
jgi:exoribonuclease R